MGRKCAVEGCLSDSNNPEDSGVTFHKIPMQPQIRTKWLELCRISMEKKLTRVVQVCSRHFLRADFCNFKGRKYMLRQGVYPSVFPWDRSILEAIKEQKKVQAEMSALKPDNKQNEVETIVKPVVEVKEEPKDPQIPVKIEEPKVENLNLETTAVKLEPADFSINNRIYALDFNNKWNTASIVEVDEEENEVLVHFENNANDEWICMDSPRLRPLNSIPDDGAIGENQEGIKTEVAPADSTVSEPTEQAVPELKRERKKIVQKYDVGEKCLAYWSDRRKFPATVTKIMDNDMYEVLFDDGYVKCVKSNRLVKTQEHLQAAPLFDPVQGTKQDRRDKKRKLNVAELFGIGKRQRSENNPGSPKPRTQTVDSNIKSPVEGESNILDAIMEKAKDELLEDGKWLPRWIDGHPVGIDSQLELHDGMKKSVIVPDPRLPEGWAKHLIRRYQGMQAGKWETIILSPDGKRFRSRVDIKNYLETTKLLPYDEKVFDFSIYRQRQKKSTTTDTRKTAEVKAAELKPETKTIETKPKEEKMETDPTEPETNQEEEEVNLLKIPIVDDCYKCPIEGCGKNFRRENLAQMHVKHYHPEYSKYLDTTPNVADLAYARTVGDALDKSPIAVKPKSKVPTLKNNTSQPQSPSIIEPENHRQSPTLSKAKDSEIIKLLTTKPYDSKSEGEPLPSGLPPSMYPDIKLKDLLSKSEGIPKRDDLNLRTLSITRPPVGIKTLLPVRKSENINEETTSAQDLLKTKTKTTTKRRKPYTDQIESPKLKEVKEEIAAIPPSPPQPEPIAQPGSIIIEGGQLIKIVRMKQEEIINCTCGFTEEDGLMIQCELCLCWQHAYCNNIQKESEVPDKYICYICQNPLKQRTSRKYYHDQDWLKQGVLPVGSYHNKEEDVLQKRFETLKKSHDVSGGLVELQEFVNTLKVKLKIAEAKNHPKLYLWSKPWERLPLPEKLNENEEEKVKIENLEKEEENQLNKDLKSMIENQPQVPIIPQPEAAIESADCRLNLLDHIVHSQDLVMERLDNFEKQLDELEGNFGSLEKDEDYPRTRQTLQMLMRDLNKLEEFSQNSNI